MLDRGVSEKPNPGGRGLPAHRPQANLRNPFMTSLSEKPPLKVMLCSPRGFCAGVVRAIDTVERALAIYGKPVYVRH